MKTKIKSLYNKIKSLHPDAKLNYSPAPIRKLKINIALTDHKIAVFIIPVSSWQKFVEYSNLCYLQNYLTKSGWKILSYAPLILDDPEIILADLDYLLNN